MEELHEIIQAEAKLHSNDIDAAVSAAEVRIKKLPSFKTFVGELIRSALRNMITDWRHNDNVSMRRASGDYGGPAKVTAGSAVARVAGDYFAYFIAGKTLGNILGEELSDIAKSESERAKGHQFNVRLCEKLSAMVPKGKTVSQAVSAKKLKKLFGEI